MSSVSKIALPVLLLLGAGGAVVWQRLQVMQLQDERSQLLAAREEAAGLAGSATNLDALRAQLAEANQLKAANRDLPALRNQVRQEREARAEMERLRAQTQQLKAQLAGPVAAPKSITEMEGSVPKENWARGGFATPEATVQSFLWAIREGDIEAFASCLAPKEREDFQRQAGGDTRSAVQEMQAMAARVKGFRIAGKTETGDGKVTLSLQVAAGSDLIEIPLERVGQEWKMHDFH